jgi:hypothetical protein
VLAAGPAVTEVWSRIDPDPRPLLSLTSDGGAESLLTGGAGPRRLAGTDAPAGRKSGGREQIDVAAIARPVEGPEVAVGPLPIEEATVRALTQTRARAGSTGPRHAAAEPDTRPDETTGEEPAEPMAPVPGGGGEPMAATAAAVGAVEGSAVAAGTIDGLHHALGAAVRIGAAELDAADVEAAVSTAVALCSARPGEGVAAVARRAGESVAAMARLALPEAVGRPVNWAGFGALIPILSGSPAAGASVVAAALTDALQIAGRCALLVDAADPARSGLAAAATADGPWTHAPHPELAIRYSWREHALLARLETRLPMVTPGMVPPPPAWLPQLDPLHVTVVDIGHDGWRATANPLVGAGGWLRYGTPVQRPLIVVRPTRPSLRQAEQVLARLDRWIAAGAAVAPFALVVTGAKRWPAGVAGAAGQRLASLVEDAVFIPHDPQVEAGGITDDLLPDRLIEAVTPLLADWGLLPPSGRSSRRNPRTQGRR